MAISPELQQFKSSGVYRLEFDKSQTVNVPQETIRLVVGHSTKGPYNTPVFIENTEQFIDAFGNIDRSLERRGIYFHRSALEALSRGPILAVNLYKKEEVAIRPDDAPFVSLVTNGSVEGTNSVAGVSDFSDFFDTERFWKPTDAKLLKVVSDNYEGLGFSTSEIETEMANRVLNFVNIKQDPITVIVRQARDVRGFDVVAREWYGADNVPEGINPMDFISEYMVDVIVFKGKFDAAALSNDPIYGEFFDEDGLKKDKINDFAARREVTVLATYTGSLIPDFIDLEGRQMYIESLVNIETRRTGLFCAINEDALETMDLVGDTYDIYQDYEVLSHIVKQEVTLDSGSPAITAAAITDGLVRINDDGDELYIYGGNFTAAVDATKFLAATSAGEYLKIADVTHANNITTVTTASSGLSIASTYANEVAGSAISWPADVSTTIAVSTTTIANDTIVVDVIQTGQASIGSAGAVDAFVEVEGSLFGVVSANIAAGANDTLTLVLDRGLSATQAATINGYTTDDLTSLSVFTTNSDSLDLFTIALNSRGIEFSTDWTYESVGGGIISYTKSVPAGDPEPAFAAIKVGMYMSSLSNSTGLSRILQISKELSTENGNDIHKITITGHRHLEEEPTFALKSFDDATVSYKTFPLDGAYINKKNIKDILGTLVPGSGQGFANALVDKDNITFRYIVDTFGSLENGEILNKAQFTQLAQERQNASAILNAPMVEELRKCTNPYFVDNEDVFQAAYIEDGGNLDKNPTRLYTLPSVLEGANFGFYYGPGLTIIENGKPLTIPPAAYVSNNYIDKYSIALPWSIIAGPRRGVVSGTNVQGLEYAFDKLDRDVVEPFGINPIVFERGVGLVIKGNKTGQQRVTSALSSAHVREALIYIEDGLAAILQNYLFEFNTAQTRLEIKTLADAFMESVKKDGGVYDYRNIMDTTNNTNEVIDANIGILDTYVEPVKGLEILVSRVTVLNTGEIATANFS